MKMKVLTTTRVSLTRTRMEMGFKTAKTKRRAKWSIILLEDKLIVTTVIQKPKIKGQMGKLMHKGSLMQTMPTRWTTLTQTNINIHRGLCKTVRMGG